MPTSPSPKLTSTGYQALKSLIDEAVKDPKKDIPGVSVAISNTKGEDLFTYASGYTGADAIDKLNTEHLFWIASTTKQITTIALLQLIEQGKLKLDDAEQINDLIPEVNNLPIQSREKDGSIKLTPKKNKITLRHLLSHTAGFGYTFFNDILRDFAHEFAISEFDAKSIADYRVPLAFEPGTDWQYGINIDWAGIALERYTGQRLGHYIDENIIKPLGLEDTTFAPNDSQRENFVKTNYRNPKNNDELEVVPQAYRKIFDDKDDLIQHSGGAGLISRPKEYIKVLSTILNNGVSPLTGERILNPETVDLIFENQIPQFPDFGRKGIPDAIPYFTNPLPDLYPQAGNPPQGWGLSLFLTPTEGETGRGKNTGFWAGIANLYYWVDREKGIAGYIATQLFPFADPKVLGLWTEIEKAVYKNLE